MQINQKDIVLLPYQFSNFEEKKVRPALVVSNEILNRKSSDCLMVPLTTIIKQEPYSIIIDNNNLASGELIKQSRIRVDKIFSVEKSLIIKRIGVLDNSAFEKVKSEILKMF